VTRRRRGDILKRIRTGEGWTVERVGTLFLEVRPYLGAPEDARHPATGEPVMLVPIDREAEYFEPDRVGYVLEFRMDTRPLFSWRPTE
jgi:hypothetical protein